MYIYAPIGVWIRSKEKKVAERSIGNESNNRQRNREIQTENFISVTWEWYLREVQTW